ncbi:MAG: protein kinase [Rhodothermales bacterium]
MIGQSIENYAIEAVLGHGGMGIVYKALDTSLDRVVALKVMNPGVATNEEFLWRFKSEARVLGRLQHANIVNVYAFRHVETHLFIVMEYVGGGTLSHLIERQGIVPPKQALPIIKQSLLALEAAHDANIIHRDIKPHNILLTERGDVKISDFGLAKIQEESSSMMTRVGVTGGTLYYMPPEQSEALSKVDHRGDLYALGMTLYQMLAGRMPFDAGSSAYSILKAVAEEQIPTPNTFNRHMPPGLVEIVMRAIKKDPDQRYQSAREMREAIEQFERSTGAPPARPTAERPVGVDKTMIFTAPKAARLKPEAAPKPELHTLLPGEHTATAAPGGRMKRYLGGVLLLALVGFGVFLFRPDDDAPTRRADTSAQTPPPTNENTALQENDPTPANESAGESTRESGSELAGPAGTDPVSSPAATPPQPASQEVPATRTETTYTVNIRSTPSGATVLFDGKSRGTTPLQMPGVSAGNYPVQLQLDGYQPFSGTLQPQRQASLTATLQPLNGSLRVVIHPWGSLDINDVRKMSGSSVPYAEEMGPGSYRLHAMHPSFGEWDKVVTLRPGQHQDVFFDFQKMYRVIVTTPPITNAEIVVDGTGTGVFTPLPVVLRAGNHTIAVRKEGYRMEGQPKKITLEEDLQEPIAFTLVPEN